MRYDDVMIDFEFVYIPGGIKFIEKLLERLDMPKADTLALKVVSDEGGLFPTSSKEQTNYYIRKRTAKKII